MRTKTSLFIIGMMTSFFSFAEPITVTHQLGSVTLDSEPKRVVVIGVGVLDTLDRFGIEPVAVTKEVTFPDYLNKYKDDKYVSTGSLFEPDFETIYSQKPDVIIIGLRSTPHYDELSKIAPTIVFGTEENQSYWTSTKKQWRTIGKAFNVKQKVEQEIEALDKEFKEISAYNQTHAMDALTVMSSGGNITAFGAQSRFGTIYQDFGFKPTVSIDKTATHGDLISYEFINTANPSTLLVVDRDVLVNKGKSTTHEDFENDLIKATKAYKNGHMTFLNLNAWYLAIAGVTATEIMISDIKASIGLE
ncbi:siderophore ABC transporter substrate-binding protein [Vibrio sp. RC27]